MKRTLITLCCATVVAIAHQSASGALVVVDTVGVDVSGTAYTGAGVLDTSSRTWELKPSTGNTFTLAGSTITMTYGGSSTGGINSTAGPALFDEYKFTAGGAFGVVMTGLDPSLTYNVVYYGAQDGFGGRGTTFDMAEPNLPSDQTTGDQTMTFVEGVNYVRYDGLTAQLSDDRLRVLVGIGPDGGAGFINGFEIQALAQSVPEPSTLVLAALGFVGLVFGRRRRSRG